jgi:hypothetical protein
VISESLMIEYKIDLRASGRELPVDMCNVSRWS